MAVVSLMLVSCGWREVVAVKQFTVRETDTEWSQDLMVRGEIQKRLYGAISNQERRDRIGQYYSVRWRVPQGPVSVVFDYRQSNSGSRIHRLRQDYAAGGTALAEFAVAGEAYRRGGRVTSWRARVMQGESVLAEEASFLWE